YWNVLDPPTPVRSAYSEGVLPRYTYVSDGMMIVEGNGGDLFVLKHSGTSMAGSPAPTSLPSTPTQPATSAPAPTVIPPTPTSPPINPQGLTPQVTTIAASGTQV